MKDKALENSMGDQEPTTRKAMTHSSEGQLDLELHLRAMELKWVQLIQSNQLFLG